jgi:YHS domain-containing protein
MKAINSILAAVLLVSLCAVPVAGFAADKKTGKPKPYPLKTCVVSDEKLGEMGDAYVFVREGREIKLCCKSCLKDFKKDPAKYIKKIEEAEAKAKKTKK